MRFLFLICLCDFLHCKTALGHRTFSLYVDSPGTTRVNRPWIAAWKRKRTRVAGYSVAAGSLDLVRAGKSNSTLPSSFKTRGARKGLPLLERKPEKTVFVFA